MSQSKLFQIKDEIPWQKPGIGIERQVYGYDDSVMMVKLRFESNAIGALHHHPHTQVTYIESGVFEMTIADQKKILTKGDGYYVPPHAIHGIVCLEAGMLVEVFTPVREDFLETI